MSLSPADLCLDRGHGACRGPVEYRHPLSSSGRSFPRCDLHWEKRLREQEQIQMRYPETRPSDFSEADAGESWDEI